MMENFSDDKKTEGQSRLHPMTLTKKQMLKALKKGQHIYGVPSANGRTIKSLYLASRSKTSNDLLLVRFSKEGNRPIYFDLQLKQKMDSGVRDIQGDITFLPENYYGPTVKRMAC